MADLIITTTHQTDAPVQGPGLVIIHATRSGTSGNPNEYIGTLNWMRRDDIPLDQRVSSHEVIGRAAGQTAQVVPRNKQAWHAGEHNVIAWGVELCQGVNADGYTEPQLEQLVDLAIDYCTFHGVAARHSPNTSTSGFIGHEETPQGKRNGKSDPGTTFPWIWFLDELVRRLPKANSLPTRQEIIDAHVRAALHENMGWDPTELKDYAQVLEYSLRRIKGEL